MKILKVLRYIILALILWSLPSFLLAYFGPVVGMVSSYLSMALLLLYMTLVSQKGPAIPIFIALSLLYFLLAGLNFSGDEMGERYFFIDMVKCLLVIIAGTVVMRKTSLPELYIFLVIGALSIVINAIFFPLQNANFYPTFGRFSGFYLNPNYGGAISVIGFALSFGIKNKKLKYIGQVIFSIGGFFTLSRYFLLLWVALNLISVFINRKNIVVPMLGGIGLFIIIAFAGRLQLNADRFLAYQSILGGDKIDTETLQKDSRNETWGFYFDLIYEKPFLGHGYRQFQIKRPGLPGVHNTYLLVIGEAGAIPFLLIVGLYLFLSIKGYRRFKTEPHHAMLALVLTTGLMVTHNYFDKYSLLLISIYLFLAFTEKEGQRVITKKNEADLKELIS